MYSFAHNVFMNKKELFAARFKDLIKEKGTSLYQIEKTTGLLHGTLSRYANALNAPQLEQIWILAEYFGCTIDYLLGKTDY